MLTEQSEIVADSIAHAKKVLAAYLKGLPERLKKFQPDLSYVLEQMAARLLVHPRSLGYNLSLVDRSRLYVQLGAETRGMIYDFIAPPLQQECAAFEMDFAKLFPTPPNLEQARQTIRKRMEEATERNQALPK